MQIKYNNATSEYDVINNGNVLFSSDDSLFGKKECEYYFLKEQLNLDEELVRSYGRYEVSYDNSDEIVGVDLFDSDGNHTKHISKDEINSVLNNEIVQQIQTNFSTFIHDAEMDREISSIIEKKLKPLLKDGSTAEWSIDSVDGDARDKKYSNLSVFDADGFGSIYVYNFYSHKHNSINKAWESEVFVNPSHLKNNLISIIETIGEKDMLSDDLKFNLNELENSLNNNSIIFNGKNGREVISFLKDNDIQFYQEDSGKLRALINKKMTTIFKDDKICIDYKGDGRGFAQSIVKPELYGGSNGITLSDIRDITFQEKEDGDYEFLVSYSSQYSETPEYDTFNKETIQEMFKNIPQEEFSFNVVPYLEGKELEKMLNAVYPSRTDNISLNDGLSAIVVDNNEVSVNTDAIKEFLLSEYHKAGVKNLQIDAIVGAIETSIKEAIDSKTYDEELRISKNISIDCFDDGKVSLHIDRQELTSTKDFENVFSISSFNMDNSFPETDVVTISEKDTVSIEDLKNIKNSIATERELSNQNPVVLKSTDALKSYILDSNSHNIADLLDIIENNFGTEQKDSFLESFQKYTDDPLDSYYNSSVLLSVFSDDISNLSEELGENEEQDNLYSPEV